MGPRQLSEFLWGSRQIQSFAGVVDGPNFSKSDQCVYVPGRYPTTWLVQVVADFEDGWASEIAPNWTLDVVTICGVGRSKVDMHSTVQLAGFGQYRNQGFIPADTLQIFATLSAAAAVSSATKRWAVSIMTTPQLPIVERL